MKGPILVYDDEDEFVNRYTRKLEDMGIFGEDFPVLPLLISDFVREMKVLIDRQRLLRKGETEHLGSSALDTAAVFVVDFDLVESDPGAEWTSEDVAYLARCFSNCGLVLGLNLRTCPEFDLTLRGNLGSYADLNIVAKQLGNTLLWEGKAERDKFRPWHWPPLLRFLEQFDEKVSDVQKHFNDPICDVLGMQDVAKALPRSVGQFLGGDDPLKTTFADFVARSPNALRAKEKNLSKEAMSRIAAARISKWLERRVLPGQDIVVDAPHLVMRYPSLLEGDHSMIETWNKTAAFDDFRALGIKCSMIEAFRFKKSHWISRPVWFWRKLTESENIEEVVEPWRKEPPRYLFCEDTSMFYETELCRGFDAQVDSPYVRRYVRCFDDIDYQPRMRIL